MPRLFTSAIDKKLFQQFTFGNDLSKQKVVAKLFYLGGDNRWYLLNSDPNDPDYIWAITSNKGQVEIGSISRKALTEYASTSFGGNKSMGIERDIYFTSENAEQVYQGVKEGNTYETGGILLEIQGSPLNDVRFDPIDPMFDKGGQVHEHNLDVVLQDCMLLLNKVPNKKGPFGNYKNSYELASSLDTFTGKIQGNKPEQQDLFKGIEHFLNKLPNTKFNGTEYHNSYELASAFDKCKDEKYARGGVVKKEDKLAVTMAISYLAVFQYKHKESQVGFQSTKEVIEKLKANPYDEGNNNMAVLYLKSLQILNPDDSDSIETTIKNLQALKNKYADGGIVLDMAGSPLNDVRFDPIDPMFKKGGRVKFKNKVKAISKNLEGKKVPKKYQKENGKVYNKDEATVAAKKIAGSIRKKELQK